MSKLTWFVRACAIYNLVGATTFLIPGLLESLGARVPASPFWLWLPALMGCFAAIVLLLSSFDLTRYGSFPYYNGLVRLAFVVASFALSFGESVGELATYLALGDLPLALGAIFGIPAVLGKSHRALLLNA